MILTLEQAEDVAARTRAAIDDPVGRLMLREVRAADRERVASDLAGLVDVYASGHFGEPEVGHRDHVRRYSDGLLRTARLYGVEP